MIRNVKVLITEFPLWEIEKSGLLSAKLVPNECGLVYRCYRADILVYFSNTRANELQQWTSGNVSKE